MLLASTVAFVLDDGRPLMLQHRLTGSWRSALPGRWVLAVSAGLVGLLLVLANGLSLPLSLIGAVDQPPGGGTRHSDSGSARPEPRVPVVSVAVARARDELASRPMPETGSGHEFGYPELSTRDPGPIINLPVAAGFDELGVGTGFPPTLPGALAQLAAVDVVALQSGSLPTGRAIIRNWAVPGGPTTENWSLLRAMASLLESAGSTGAGSARLAVTVRPAMGLVKGTVGADFAVV
jgi:hypothetical protein